MEWLLRTNAGRVWNLKGVEKEGNDRNKKQTHKGDQQQEWFVFSSHLPNISSAGATGAFSVELVLLVEEFLEPRGGRFASPDATSFSSNTGRGFVRSLLDKYLDTRFIWFVAPNGLNQINHAAALPKYNREKVKGWIEDSHNVRKAKFRPIVSSIREETTRRRRKQPCG